VDQDGISLLIRETGDFVIDNQGNSTKIAELRKNKVVGFYFSAHWCGPCRSFTPVLAEKYNEMKKQGKEFEIVFISSDSDEKSFGLYHHEMPWLALPYSDADTRKKLSLKYSIRGIPSVILVDGDGKILTESGRSYIQSYGSEGFPFTEERIQELKKKDEEKMQSLPKTVKDARHEHELNLVPNVYHGSYGCDGCGTGGSGWVYHCDPCQFDLHPGCAKQE